MSTLSPYVARVPRSAPVLFCGSLVTPYLTVCDAASWESFDERALKEYVRSGAEALEQRIHAITDSTQVFDEAVTKELFFMLESLLYARNLLAEHSEAATGGEAVR